MRIHGDIANARRFNRVEIIDLQPTYIAGSRTLAQSEFLFLS